MPTGVPTKEKPCKICGKMFLPIKPSQRYCTDTHYANCPICGGRMIWNSTRRIEPCSSRCKKENTRRNNLIKYGCEHPMQNKEVQLNHKKAMMEKHGVESPLQSDEIKHKAVETNRKKFGTDWALSNKEIKAKAQFTMIEKYGGATTLQSPVLKDRVETTNLEKYGAKNAMQNKEVQKKVQSRLMLNHGVTNPMQIESVKASVQASRREKKSDIVAKARETYLKNYQVDNPSKCPAVLDKIEHTMIRKYGYRNALQVPEFKQKLVDTNLNRYEVPYYCMSPQCQQYNGHTISSTNQRISNMLSQREIPHTLEKRIDRKSFDICIESEKILLEINPTYTHNSIGNHWNKDGINADYHASKSELARTNGYRCIHVFDWDNIDKIIQSLEPKEKINARECSIYKLNQEVATQFLEKYHFQGSCRGQLLCLGLVLNNELYQVMTFGRSRYSNQHNVEMLRLCTRPRYIVRGGASKLFKFATKDYGLSNIISYCDLSKFNGHVYEELGMKLVRITPPQEIWSKGNKKITSNLLRQQGYNRLFNTNYDESKSNEGLMIEGGWLPVYDCGQAVYEYI